MPVCVPEKAGQPYRPSNGTEGMMFEEMFCERCRHDYLNPEGCEIVLRATFLEIQDEDYPRDKWVYGDDGRPRCVDFAPIPEADSPEPKTRLRPKLLPF